MPDTTVCFVARTDFESKPGGDTVQWQLYERAAREAGLQTRTWFDDSPMPEADVFHAFNVDRPLELYPKLVDVKRRGRPFILSTIHRPNEWLMRFRRFQPPTGLLGKLVYRSPIGRSVPASEATREVAMLLLQRRLNHVRDLRPSWRTRVRWLIANADRLALLTHEEATWVEEDFAYPIRPEQAWILPNWIDGADHPSAATPTPFGDLSEAPVIVVGRIEPLKNSVRVSRLAEIAQRPVVFIGRPHPTETAFVEAFKETIRCGRYARWIPGVPRSELARFYCHASFLLNASLTEVSPMVDIEALAFGCPVATTKYALHLELLPPNTPRCDPYDDRSILEQLRWRPQRWEPVQAVDAEKCKRDLVETYVTVGRLPTADSRARRTGAATGLSSE